MQQTAILIALVSIVFAIAITLSVIALTIILRRAFNPENKFNKILAVPGEIAKATVLNIQMSNMKVTIGGVKEYWKTDLSLEVQPANGQPYTVNTHHYVPVLEIPQFQPGGNLLVKIHAEDNSKVDVIQSLGDLTVNLESPEGKYEETIERLIRTQILLLELYGKPNIAPAKILDAKETGIKTGGNPQIAFQLQVQTKDGSTFIAQTEGVVQQASIDNFKVGGDALVLYDPADTTKVSIHSSGQ